MTEYILINVALLMILIYAYFKIKHGIHMLQLESYKNERYTKWTKKNKHKVLKMFDLFLILPSIVIFINYNIGIILEIILLVFLTLFREKYKEKKPLVVTNRVKRMYVTYSITFIIFLLLCNFVSMNFIIFLNIFIILSYFSIVLINIINSPIEKNIQQSFYKKAKNKLDSMPELQVVGITGSYGKTSCKYILSTILEQKYNVLMTPESYNTTMGVVRTINEKLKPLHQIFVCEMGAKNIGDIKEICDLVNPDYGILTAIGPQHLETFKNIENVKKTKLELIDSVEQNGYSFVNFEDENIKNISFKGKNIKFSLENNTDYYAEDIEINEKGSKFNVKTKQGDTIEIKTKLLGRHNIVNIVGAVAVAVELGLSKEEIKTGVRFLKPVPHRLELKQNPNGSITIDDAYNSNSKGAKMALDVLSNFKNRQKIIVTPGIVDLGEKQEEYNEKFGNQIAESNLDYVILVGKEQAKPIYKGMQDKNFSKDKIYIAKNLEDAINRMNQIVTSNSVVLFENDLPDNYL